VSLTGKLQRPRVRFLRAADQAVRGARGRKPLRAGGRAALKREGVIGDLSDAKRARVGFARHRAKQVRDAALDDPGSMAH
jgi:hypothetical protein